MPVTTGRSDEAADADGPEDVRDVSENGDTASAPTKKNAITAAAHTSHLSCSRSSPRERRKRTTSAASAERHDERARR